MKMFRKTAVLLALAFAILPAAAQDFVGCRMGDGWAETPMLRKKADAA